MSQIDCGLFAIVVCLHMFDGTRIGPHIFTQDEISKLRTLLLRSLVKDRNQRHHDIHVIFPYLMSPSPSELPHQGDIPTSPLGGVELPKTIKLTAGGLVVGTISFKPERYQSKPLFDNLFDSLSSEDDDDHEVKSVVGRIIDDDNNDVA